MESTIKFFCFISILLCGLVAGLLYGYLCSVNPGLKALSDFEYLNAMQKINLAIQNPLFFISFLGTLFMMPATCIFLFKYKYSSLFSFFVFATIIYIIGVFGITLMGNVPLNNQLAAFDLSKATLIEISEMRFKFEIPWNNFHLYRTIAAILSFSLGLIGILKK
jgi:uncharacterized membrane protein